ncbi:hypothetical protein Tco_0804578 [Tanacetum coccineum]|uniref:Uncharacterized protein n=1 Tax=Tanacetum coccineum TaxID=301880 RepID=A0ABQ5A5L1_9ASTR
MISPDFVEANYEVLESLLRERRKRIRNEGLRTELEYFSEEYDKERKIESRPERERETTLVLRMRSLRARRQRERVVGVSEALNREWGGARYQLSFALAAHLRRSENVQPLQSSLTFVYEGH